MFHNHNRKEDTGMGTKSFGKKITTLRKEKGLTQAKLAEKINVSNKTISRWETGEGYPEISLLKPLAAALGTTVDDLLSEEEDADIRTDGAEENKEEEENKEQKDQHINTGMESKYEQIPVDVKALKELRFKDFWRSLVIFNKVAFGCLGICLILVITATIYSILDTDASMLFAMFTMYPIVICSVGLFSSVLGLILDLLGCYKKQTRGYVVFAAICFMGRYIFPWMAMLSTALFSN